MDIAGENSRLCGKLFDVNLKLGCWPMNNFR